MSQSDFTHDFNIEAKTRDLSIKPDKLRASGQLPAELYGHGVANMHLQLPYNPFVKLLRAAGSNTIVKLTTEDGKLHNVLVHDVQRHYLRGNAIHVDLFEVSMTEKVTATIPLEFEGTALAVKGLGGTLVKVLTEVTVECLPGDLPHALTVDISKLNTFADTLHISDISLPKGVVISAEGDDMVAKVQAPRDVESELAEPIIEDVNAVEGVVKPEKADEKADAK